MTLTYYSPSENILLCFCTTQTWLARQKNGATLEYIYCRATALLKALVSLKATTSDKYTARTLQYTRYKATTPVNITGYGELPTGRLLVEERCSCVGTGKGTERTLQQSEYPAFFAKK